jgi:hypothetical protein
VSPLPPQWLLLHLDHEASPAARRELEGWLAAVLPHLDWRCHLVLAGDPEQTLALASVAAAHVERHPFVTVRLQPCLDGNLQAERELLALARRFQNRAYREQTEPGFELLPVLAPPPGASPTDIVDRVVRLRSRLAEPRLVLDASSASEVEAALAAEGLAELRRDVLPPDASGPRGVIAALGTALVLESVVDRLEGDPADTLAPCRPHLVADQGQGLLFPCVRAFALGQPFAPLEPAEGGVSADLAPPAERCPECFAASTPTAAPGLAASGRRPEATAASLRVAVALAAVGEHAAAASCAACAADLAGAQPERAGAFLLEGLCRHRAGDLAGAVDRFRRGLDTGVDPEERPRVLIQLADCLDAAGRAEEADAARAEAAWAARGRGP